MKKKFNFRKLIITSMCLLFGLILSNVFVWQNNMQKQQVVEIAGDMETLENEVSLKVEWNKFDKPKFNVQPVSANIVTDESTISHSFNIENMPGNIVGGTVVTITKSKPSIERYTINFDANGDGDFVDENEGFATLTINTGYELKRIEMGNTKNGAYKTVYHENYTTFSATVEEIDPDYDGTLIFKAVASEITYFVDFFYRNDDGVYDNSHKFTYPYAISASMTESHDIFSNDKVNGNDVDWLFKVSDDITVTDEDASTAGIQYKYESSDKNIVFSFDAGVDPIKIEGYKLYKLIGVSGYGDFIGGNGQSVSNPTIIAQTVNSYTFNVVNEGKTWESNTFGPSYWADRYNSLNDDAKSEFKDVYGVKVSGSEAALTTEAELIDKISSQSGNEFLIREGGAFETGLAVNNNYGYLVYNYGFDLTHYLISVEFDGGETKYLDYNSGEWTLSDNAVLCAVGNLEYTSLADIAAFADKNIAVGVVTLPTITLTPIWKATEILIENGGYTIGSTTYAGNYQLDPLDDKEGQTFFCYADVNVQLIANSAVWNYTGLTGYEHLSGPTYTFEVIPQYLDNVYKTTLNNTSVNAVIKNGGDYDESSEGSIYNANEYNYSNIPGLTLPTTTSTTGLSDEITENLTDFYNDYVQILTDSPIYRKVFSNGTKYIYLINDAEVGVLPTFEYTYQQEILWKAGEDNRYTTSNYSDIFSLELDDKEKTKWEKTYGQTLTPVYVYRLDLYYEDNDSTDGIFSSLVAEWFGAETSLDFVDLNKTDVAENKTFSSWMIDVETIEKNYSAIYSFSDNGTNTITISSKSDSSLELIFKYDTKVDNKYYYGVESVVGYGAFIQNNAYPIVRAKFAITYNVLIDNSSNYWGTVGVDDDQLFGAYSNNGTAESYSKTTLSVSAHDTYKYPFQESLDMSFLKRDNITKTYYIHAVNASGTASDDYYYVYNYGHYITGWKIAYNTLVYNGTNWASGNDEIGISNLQSLTFGDIVAAMDLHFPSLTGIPTITLTPAWSGVNIDVKYGNTIVGNDVTYARSYSLTSASNEEGQTFFCYADVNVQLIANSADWNYIGLTGYEYKSGSTYTLAVTPQYLDDVYKVALNSVINSSRYELESTDFSFAADGDAYTTNVYNYVALNGNVTTHNSTTYPLVENYVANVVSAYQTEYNSMIDGKNNDDHEIFKKVYYSTGSISSGVLTATNPSLYIYLANNQVTGNLPMFKHKYAQVIAWDDNASTKTSYKTSGFENDGDNSNNLFRDEVQETVSEGMWKYGTGKTLFNTVYVYSLDMFYENSSGNYSTKTAAWFGEKTKLEGAFETELTETDIATGKVFAGWMINAEMAKNTYGYTVVEDETNKTIKISASTTTENFELTFTYKTKSEYRDYYYEITSVVGYGVFAQAKIIDKQNCPIVLARLGRTYELTIDNNYNIYWANQGLSNEEKAKLYGTMSSDERDGTNDNDFTQTTLTVANKEEYEYPFQTSEQEDAEHEKFALSFYKQEDMSESVVNSKVNNSYYYVYNYGHYISGWKISCLGQSFIYDSANSKWKVSNDGTDLASLERITFRDVAELIDDYFATEFGALRITIEPIWTEVNIDVKYSEQSLVTSGTISFCSTYTLNTGRISKPLGQELIAFTYGEANDLIAVSAVWNYYNKNNKSIDISDLYAYSVGENNGAGTYTLNVTPVYVNNIYKINLTNAKIVDTNKYQLTNSNYAFNANTGSYNAALGSVVTFKNNIDTEYQYAEYSAGLVDDYIAQLVGYRDDYVAGIQDGGFDIFRKVYYSTGTVGTTSVQNDTLIVTSTPTFWIYLANNQKTGALPVFEKDYYTHIFWQNTIHCDNSTCVGVDTCVNPKHYIYKTNDYKQEAHVQELFSDLDLTTQKYLWHDEDIWNLEDGHDGNNVTFNAYYYRKYYFVEVSTLVGEVVERRGYVRIDIVDNLYEIDNTITDRSGHYIIIAELNTVTTKTEMKVYKVVDSTSALSTYNNVVNKTGALAEAIKLYDGCEIILSVKDQSQDTTAMASANFDEMIGYKFTGNIDQTVTYTQTHDTDIFSGSNYIYSSTANVISAKNYNAASTFKLNVYFEKIIYNLNFAIDNVASGEFNVQFNQLYSGYKTAYTLSNMSVDNFYEVGYFAFAGYKLKNDAFNYYNNKNDKTLQVYDDSTNVSQVYTLTSTADNKFNGTWLREHFYSSFTTYPIDVVNLGMLTIQTDVVVFNYGVLIYDDTDITEAVLNNKGIVETLDDGEFCLTYATGIGSVNSVGDYLTNGDEFYYYDSLSGVDYAVLSSRMFLPNNPITTNNNFYTTYNFLLKTKPTTQSNLSSSDLALMVQNYEDGKIVSAENRNIYVLLEVRKIYTITMQVVASANDTNNSARTTTLSNGNNNSQSIIITSGNSVVDDYYADNDLGLTRKIVEVKTYHGLTNTVTSDYTASKYSGVEYYLDNIANSLSSNEFTVEKDSTLTIEYTPKSLAVEFIYLLNDIDVVEEDVSTYITQVKPTKQGGLKVDDVVPYKLTLSNKDYNARVTINGNVMGATDNNNSTIDCSYTVSDPDMVFGVVQIVVEIYPRSNARININFTIDDTSKKDLDDDYGAFTVYVDDDLKADRVESAPVDVIEGRSVYVSLNLSLGYHYVGIKKGTYSTKLVEQNADGKILLIEEFDLNKDAGDYYIVVGKDNISATLDTSHVKTNEFKNKTYINGAKTLSNLYVGSVISFTFEDVNAERLDYFYYTYKDDQKNDVEVEIATETFKITSEILELYPDENIKLGVKTISRYNFTMAIVGQQYLEEDVVVYYSDDSIYEIGTYTDEGTELTFSVKPNGVSEGKFKYNIACDNGTYEVINSGDIIIILNKNYNYTITITPKTYEVTISENVYNDITQVENGTPESVATNQVNNLNVLGQTKYNSETTLEFTRVAYNKDRTPDRELSRVIIEDNDRDETIIIEFKGTSYIATIDGVEINLVSYGYRISNLSTGSNTVKLTYITLSNISITLDYKDYKVINGG